MGIRLFLVVLVCRVIKGFFCGSSLYFLDCIHLQRYGAIVASVYLKKSRIFEINVEYVK